MLEIINKIKETETEADRLKKDAQQQSANALAKAQSDGKQLLSDKKALAQKEAEVIIKSAEKAADEFVKQQITQTSAQCEALTNTAGSRLEKAAELIVGRVIGNI